MHFAFFLLLPPSKAKESFTFFFSIIFNYIPFFNLFVTEYQNHSSYGSVGNASGMENED